MKKYFILTACIAAIALFYVGQKNLYFNSFVWSNIEALSSDVYENRVNQNGNTIRVFYISKELTYAEKKALKSEAYYIEQGLPNPYHYMYVSSESLLPEKFYNKTKGRWEDVPKCSGNLELCTGEILAVCWAIKFPSPMG